MNSWGDQLLIVSTPLLIVPVVFFLYSPMIGVEVQTIAMVVTAFFALGHHLPGMIRAYGDRELFQRFRLRFILAPIMLTVVCFPLYRYHFDVILMTLYFWGSWHALMQLYGFVRIYDVKVGSISPTTAYWDWLMCLCWFPTALLFSSSKLAILLGFWYSFDAPLIPPLAISVFRWTSLGISIFVLIGFLVNYTVQSFRGPQPNPIKLSMLASGIGFWWFTIVYVDNTALGVTLFEIAHDVQYMAITWMYNCRRTKSNPAFDGFMRFVFRRGMSLLYVGLIASYGAIGLVPSLVQDGTVKTFFSGLILVSTILHYYYDGFIWKVREKSTQAGFGVRDEAAIPRTILSRGGGFTHFLKWSPMILFVGWVFLTGFTESSLSPEAKERLRMRFGEKLLGSSKLPTETDEQSWLFTEFAQVQKIAATLPGDQQSQMRAAIMLANFGRNDQAVQTLEKLLNGRPDVVEADLALGEIHLYRGSFDEASLHFQKSLSHAKTKMDRANANLKLGDVYVIQKRFDLAKERFQDALRDNPKFETAINEALSKIQEDGDSK